MVVVGYRTPRFGQKGLILPLLLMIIYPLEAVRTGASVAQVQKAAGKRRQGVLQLRSIGRGGARAGTRDGGVLVRAILGGREDQEVVGDIRTAPLDGREDEKVVVGSVDRVSQLRRSAEATGRRALRAGTRSGRVILRLVKVDGIRTRLVGRENKELASGGLGVHFEGVLKNDSGREFRESME